MNPILYHPVYTALTQATHALVSDLNIANGVYWDVKDEVFWNVRFTCTPACVASAYL